MLTGESTLDQIQHILDFTGMPSDEMLDRNNLTHSRHILEHCFRGQKSDLRTKLTENASESLVTLVLSMLKFDPL